MTREAFFLLALLYLFWPGILPAQDPMRILTIGTIAIEGAEKTRHQVILNEMVLLLGDSISADQVEATLQRSEQNIYNLALFNEVTIESYELHGELHLIVKVTERWYLFGSPYLQVEERNSYDLVEALTALDFHRLVYGASVEWRNITGRNETLFFFGQLGFSQRLRLDLILPTLSRNRIGHRLGIGFRNQHEIIIGTENGRAQWRRVETEPLIRVWNGYIGARRRIGLYKTLYARLSYDHIRMSDSLYAFSLENQAPGTLTSADGLEYYPSLTVQFFEDQRDYRGFPLSGWKYQLLGRWSGMISGVSTTGFGKIGATWAHHLPIGQRFNFSYGTQHLFSIGDSIPFFAKSFLGISQSEFIGVSTNLRGYEPYAISTTYMGIFKTEWKYAIIPRQILHFEEIPYRRFQDLQIGLYLSMFADVAYLRDEAFNGVDQTMHRQLLSGYGVGLNVIGFYDMLLRVEYTRNHLNQGGLYFHTDLQNK